VMFVQLMISFFRQFPRLEQFREQFRVLFRTVPVLYLSAEAEHCSSSSTVPAHPDVVIFARSFERVVQSVAACGSRDRCVISRPFGGRRSTCGAIDDDPSLSVSLFAHARSLSLFAALASAQRRRTVGLSINVSSRCGFF
jgi:hypothetical protein